jgi:hypothetical protein
MFGTDQIVQTIYVACMLGVERQITVRYALYGSMGSCLFDLEIGDASSEGA